MRSTAGRNRRAAGAGKCTHRAAWAVATPQSSDDCQRCGACCCNPRENIAEGFCDYVEVDRDDPLMRRPDLLRRFVVLNEGGVPHLRLDGAGRCLALRGSVGQRVWCAIYRYRPGPCRRVEPGSELCRRYRTGVLAPVQVSSKPTEGLKRAGARGRSP